MSKEILKALMHLFGIITKQDGGVTQKEHDFALNFLIDTIGEGSSEEYIELFEKHSNYGQELTEKDKQKLTSVRDSVRTLAICKKINKTLSQKQKTIVLIRLFELLKIDNNFSNQRVMIINTVSDVFNIDKVEFKLIEEFVTVSEAGDFNTPFILVIKDIRRKDSIDKYTCIHAEGLNGHLSILHIESVDMYFMGYNGEDSISLNGRPVKSGSIYLFAYGSVIKLPKSDPIFYSDAVAHFLSDEEITPVSFNAVDLEYKFPNGAIGLQDITISETNNKLIAIMGASGAGKTTLLNTLSGLETPSKGAITINGNNIFEDKDKIEGVIGYISQDDILIEELTVYENLYFSAKLCLNNLSEKEIEERVEHVLDNLGLLERRDLKVGSILDKTISGGQRKRLNIALELIREPDVLFVDEPTSGLSSRDSENVIDLLKELSLKGKLIFVVIHQPSSDIYKMFDKIIILDVGGVPIYNGHPVEAVTYFKKEAHQLNSESGQCNLCGNVNPEQIFNIIEERVVDEYGNFTENRKIKPTTWYQRYKEKIRLDTVKPIIGKLPQNLHIPSKAKQLFLFVKRDLMSKLSNTQYLLINLLQAPLLAGLLSFIIKYVENDKSEAYLFRENENLPAYLFMSIIVSFFMGLTVSAEEIIKDRKLLKRESLLNLSRNSYLVSKILILFTLSAIQSLLFVLVGNSILEIHGMYLSYWLMFFAISCSANVLGLNISASFNSAITIYILIPLLIIPQMILSGAIFDFDKLNSFISSKEKVPLVADMMVARWAFEGLAVDQVKDNLFEEKFYEIERKESIANFKKVYYIPKLEDLLDEIIISEKENASHHTSGLREKIEHNLFIIKNEIIQENQLNSRVTFTKVNELDYKHFRKETSIELKKYFESLNKYYQTVFNVFNHKKDNYLTLYEDSEKHKKAFQLIKDEYTNDNLVDILKNINTKKRVIEYKGHLVQKIDPVFKNPSPLRNPLDYRTHFYSPTKPLFGRLFDTYWFNFFFIWLGTVLMYITLYFETLRWLIDKMGKISFIKTKD